MGERKLRVVVGGGVRVKINVGVNFGEFKSIIVFVVVGINIIVIIYFMFFLKRNFIFGLGII